MSRQSAWLAPLALVALCCALYANALRGDFQFDDATSIVGNAAIARLDPHAWWSFWPGRVVAYASFALDRHWHGLSPLWFHVTNVAVHTGSTLAVYWLIAQLAARAAGTRSARTVAFAAGALFAAHPLQTQAVAYIVQRTAALCAGLYVTALATWLHGQPKAAQPRRGWTLPVALALGLLATLTKELALTLPLAAMLLDRAVLSGGAVPQRERARGWGDTARRTAPLWPLAAVVPLVAAVGHTFGVAGGALTGETPLVPRSTYALTQVDVVARYLRLLVLPIGQNVDHAVAWRTSIAGGSPPLLLLLAVHAAILVAALLAWRRGHRVWALGPLWFTLTLLPESSFFPIRDAMFEHRLYLPMVGVALLGGLGVERVSRGRPLWGGLLLVAVVAGLGAATLARNRVWRTPETLWRDAVAKSPNKARPHLGLGAALGRSGQFEEAQRELERAIALRPGFEEAWTNLGNLRLTRGDAPGAIAAYRSAIQARADHAPAWYNLGVALDRAGDLEGAATSYARALQLRPGDPAALNALAALRLRQGRAREALELAQQAARAGGGAARLIQEIQRVLAEHPTPEGSRSP